MSYEDADDEDSPRRRILMGRVDLYTVGVSTLASILVAVIAAVTTTLSTSQTIENDRESRQEARRVVQLEGARAKRETVYEKYLDAVNLYAVATNNLLDVCAPPTRATAEVLQRSCPAGAYAEFNTRRSTYQGELNRVYTFGTPEAVVAARIIAELLPSGLASRLSETPIVRPDPAEFTRRYTHFADIQCRDVRLDPEQPCL